MSAMTEKQTALGVLPVGDKQTQPQIEKMAKIGKAIITQTAKIGEKYLELCSFIRGDGDKSKAIAPALVTQTLLALGFHKVRVSEIQRVAQCSDEQWNAFAARTIGFKKVLELQRGSAALDVLEVSAEYVEENTEPEAEKPASAGRAPAGETEEQRIERLKLKINDVAKQLLAIAAKIGSKSRKWKNNGGYELTLKRVRGKSVAAADAPEASEPAAE